MQMADNAGATDEHRALNYLAVRYQAIYANAAEAFGRNASLTGVDVAHVALERDAQGGRSDFLLHQPQHRCGGEVLLRAST